MPRKKSQVKGISIRPKVMPIPAKVGLRKDVTPPLSDELVEPNAIPIRDKAVHDPDNP